MGGGGQAEAWLAQAIRKVAVSHQARVGSVPRGGLQETFIVPPAALGHLLLPGPEPCSQLFLQRWNQSPLPPSPQPSFIPSFSLSRPWPHPQTRLQVSGRALAFLSELGQAHATDQRNPREFQIVPGSAGLDLPHKV